MPWMMLCKARSPAQRPALHAPVHRIAAYFAYQRLWLLSHPVEGIRSAQQSVVDQEPAKPRRGGQLRCGYGRRRYKGQFGGVTVV